jgi:hypothetical protein
MWVREEGDVLWKEMYLRQAWRSEDARCSGRKDHGDTEDGGQDLDHCLI